jgi:hypothetical protein
MILQMGVAYMLFILQIVSSASLKNAKYIKGGVKNNDLPDS